MFRDDRWGLASAIGTNDGYCFGFYYCSTFINSIYVPRTASSCWLLRRFDCFTPEGCVEVGLHMKLKVVHARDYCNPGLRDAT